MPEIVYSEIKGRSRNQCYWQDDVEALALEAEQLKTSPPPDDRVVELEQEIEDGWDTLMNTYDGDNKCEFVDDETTIEQVKIRDGIQQFGEVAYQWRQERDDLKDKVDRMAELEGTPDRKAYLVADGKLNVSETQADDGVNHYKFVHATAERERGASNVMAAFVDALKWLDGEQVEIIVYHNKAALDAKKGGEL